ncbi:alpha-amylase family glycosyl hydrolase [Bifidobacterium sp. ESL0784]|uniref:alpha-amylase family glycosyl hydrolase n=1 Tax=Bifidobacterium sp. ESL0784 TaxID=2983231 RepID=UPI0023F6CC8E|nr:alpha-amylase family glycosyl hydrolase [Bifidobacterium sp. ESL0784]MDF7641146.1 alpha-amylase family glycosyl hydrolase [Bifidobacterium sp. ESL0784]
MSITKTPSWLQDARFYEIYPQSFYDSNCDGIGDLPGITEKLDYIHDLGCNAIWINPCFDSPFKDAGYDVRDYKKIAPRYGTNQDMVDLFEAAHSKGMHVLLDLVPGHTSEEHEWFKASQLAERNEFSDRYIWTNGAFERYTMPFVGGECPRDGAYILNYFKSQPALNYGFGRRDRAWQMSPDSPAARATRNAMVDVMRFWLSKGCDGFRVDLADSLVKNDDADHSWTVAAWRQMFATIRPEFPEAAFVSEWSNPKQSFAAGFDMDFYLDNLDGGQSDTKEGNGYHKLVRNILTWEGKKQNLSYVKAESSTGIGAFLSDYLPLYRSGEGNGYFCMITCNHDTNRIMPMLSQREYKLVLAMILTMPGAPFIYYGDEIGMNYLETLPTKEGGYRRTGTRTPMQWSSDKNLGFSQADPDLLYLPVDSSPDAPTVAEQLHDDDSLLNWTRSLLHLRDDHPALSAGAGFEVLAAPDDGKSFVYRRLGEDSGDLVIALNPGLENETVTIHMPRQGAGNALVSLGQVALDDNGILRLGPQSCCVFGFNR